MQRKKECLSIKLMAEQEAVLFRQQLLALRQALARAQADNVRMRKQQDNQVWVLEPLFLPLSELALQSWMWHWKQHQAAWDQSPGLHSVRLSTWHSQTTMAHFLLSGPETKERGQEAFVFICIWLRQGSTTHTKDHSLACSVYVCVFLWESYYPEVILGCRSLPLT